jgi:hypothetical protein
MTLQPIDIPSILSALAWPSVVAAALFVFRHSAADLAKLVSERVQKLSFAGFGVEFATVRNVTPASLDVELRQMSGAPPSPSGSANIYQLYQDLLYGGPQGYVVVDLGSDEKPQWITSRLYLLAYLITLIDPKISMVFVETFGGVRQRYIGFASPDDVRWALARRYVWLEPAMAGAYAMLARGNFMPVANPTTGQIPPPSGPQVDRNTGRLDVSQASQLMSAFLANVRGTVPPPNALKEWARDWIDLGDGAAEYAVWLNARRLERRLGKALSRACVIVPPNEALDDLGPAVLKQQGNYVAVLDSERQFQGLLDRYAILDRFVRDYSKQVRTAEPEKASG